MGTSDDEFSQAAEIIAGHFYFLTVRRPDSPRYSPIAQSNICYTIDDELLYEPFFADFGPLNLGRTNRFCQKTKQLLLEAEKQGKKLFLYAGPHAHQKANASVLVGIYQVIYLNRTADVAYKPLAAYKPFVPFRDASCGVSTFHLTVYDVLRGIQRARDVGFIDWNSGSSTWSLDEYEHHEQVENGDLNWILPGKFVAFSGPAARCNEVAGYRLHTPEDYWDYFRRKGVAAVVRLNKKVYDRKRFLDGGFKHHELYFPDGSCPSDAIIQRFLDLVEAEPGAVAVHCKAGLGRTGVLICLYLMKHYRFTAEEVIGYIRVCRPGSVIGPQQNFVREMESRMWHEGELYRAARGLPKVAAPVSDLMVAGRAAAAAELTPSAAGSLADSAAANGRNGHYNYSRASGTGGPSAAAAGAGGGGGGVSRTGSAGSAAAAARGDPYGVAAAPAAPAAAGDMSLLQYSKAQGYGSGGYYGQDGYGASSQSGGAAASGGPPGSAGGSYGGAYGSGSYGSAFRNRYNGGSAGYTSTNGAPAGGGGAAGRSMTPLRYGQAAYGQVPAGQYGQYGGGYPYGAGAAGYPLPSSTPTRGSIAISPVSRSTPVGPSGGGGGMGRSPSTGRMGSAAGGASTPPPNPSGGSGAAALRSTLHTDTLGAADRPKLLPERNTQSADIGAGFGLVGTTAPGGGGGGGQGASPWRISVPLAGVSQGSSGPPTPTSPPGGGGGGGGGGMARAPSLGRSGSGGSIPAPTPGTPGSTSGGVARMLAPNGQPRKVPVALLNQYAAAGGVVGGGVGGKAQAQAGAPPLRAAYSYGMRQ